MVVWELGEGPGEDGGADAQGLRIVSLVPSLTELLFDLGLGAQVVGRTGFCVHPREAVRRVPKVGGTKTVDVAAVRALAPTHLLVNVDENERPTVEELARSIPRVVVTHPTRLEHNHALFAAIGQRFGRQREAAGLSARLREAQALLSGQSRTPRDVIYLIWKDPWMTVRHDTYIADLLAQAGLRVIAPDASRRYPDIRWEAWPRWQTDKQAPAVAAVPVLFSSEPFRFTERHLREFAREQGIDPARCLRVDGEMLSWYGSRAVAGVRYLAQLRTRLDAAATA